MPGNIHVYPDHRLIYQDHIYRCAIGRSGMIAAADKREGDGATPLGGYPIREIWYRADKIALPPVNFPMREITKNDGWCDAADHPQYNQHVKLPFTASHENLWREDNRYDVMVVLGHNAAPVIANLGSCIFFHIAEENYAPTAGCIAVSVNDMLKILPQLSPHTTIEIRNF